MRKLALTTLLALISYLPIFSQIGVGEWRDHFSLKDCHSLAVHKQYIYGASKFGLIKYDTSDGSFSKLTKVNSLSDVAISAIASDGSENVIVGYENGNIDIINGGNVHNMRDVVMLTSKSNKRIYKIQTFEGNAYLATDLGVVVLNLRKREISETYYLSNSSAENPVYQVAIVDNILYAATSTGIYSSNLENPQIKVFSSWNLFSGDQSSYCNIQPFNGSMIVARGLKNSTCSIIRYNNGDVLTLFTSPYFADFNVENYLVVSDKKSIKIIDSTYVLIKSKEDETGSILTALLKDSVVYSGQVGTGIIKCNDFFENQVAIDTILPNGPVSNLIYDIKSSKYGVWVTPGGVTSNWNNLFLEPHFSYFDGNEWHSYTSTQIPSFKNEWDLLNIAINPKNPKDVTFCSYGSGIFKVLGDSVIHYDQHNSELKNIFSADNNYVRVGGVTVDKNGVTWMNNSEIPDGGILALTQENKWVRYNYNFAKNKHSQGMILSTKNGFKWSFFPIHNKGLFVWDDNKTVENQNDDRYRSPESSSLGIDSRNAGELRLWDKYGEEITNTILTLAEDKNGVLWIGTDKGPVLIYRPSAIFDEPYPISSRINIPRNDGSGLGDYQLGDQVITSIAIDPANRKWLGTSTSGVYLLSEDGTQIISHYTNENSPLPSNTISSVHVIEETGEVLFGTSFGLVGLKGTAIKSSESNDNIVVFPNPVYPDYDGLITVTGLTAESNVKIVDVAGNLVFELQSLGGQIAWNGRGFSGEKVKSGVYYFLVLSSDGTLKGRSKVMIIN